jgi:hypothetical protein
MANGAYEDEIHKLTDCKRFGDTLIDRTEKIRELGTKNTKTMPPELVESKESGVNDSDLTIPLHT